MGLGPSPALVQQPPALVLNGLVKRFAQKVAVAGVSLHVPVGSCFGLVGPNGAGKTTTLSMASGLLRPDAGSVSVLGVDVWHRPVEAKRLLGVLPDGAAVFDRLTGAQLVTYSGLLRGMDRTTVDARRDELLEVLGLAGDAGTLVVDYSAGMFKKVCLASALIHAPRVLLLDEPFEAVDPVSATVIREILAGFTAAGGTVIVSSHVMDLVERMCDHVAIITGGRVRAAGTIEEVRGAGTLEERFVELSGGVPQHSELAWLRSSFD